MMKRQSHASIVTAVTLVLFLGVASLAEAAWTNPYWGGNWNNPSSSLLQTMVMNRAMRNATVKGNAQRRDHAGQVSGKKQVAAARARQSAVTFRPVTAKLVPRQTAEAFTRDPRERKALEKVFVQLLDIFAQDAARDGESYNLARAAAFFVVAHYTVINGTIPPENQAMVYQRNLAADLAENPNFRSMPDRKKQELYETFVIYGMFALSGYKQSMDEGKREQTETFRTFSRQCIETVLGVPAERLSFTNAGLSVAD
jgi:hypothetical protein